MKLGHSIDAHIRIPRSDSGHIRGDASVILVALSELQEVVRLCADNVKAPVDVDPTIQIILDAVDVLVTASWEETIEEERDG